MKTARYPLTIIALALLIGSTPACHRESPDVGSSPANDSTIEDSSYATTPGNPLTIEEDEIIFFSEKGCPDCELVRAALLPSFLESRGLSIADVRELDVREPSVIRELLRLEKQLRFDAPALSPIIVFAGRAYCGVEEIRAATFEEDPGIELEEESASASS